MNKRLTVIVHIAGVLAGGFLGWLYWAKVGCVTGTCPLTANPWITTGYGALLGFVVAGLIPAGKHARERADSRTGRERDR
ncbi:MAG: hypothetical protein MAG453_00935 [Calditrichaeota bacterium]|nr:hypothetical protein [Calditrichota bacterium]